MPTAHKTQAAPSVSMACDAGVATAKIDDGSSSRPPPLPSSPVSVPEPKRRKVRKGTRTCWECKRRKVRCTFAAPDDAVCTGCTRRCLRCVSQEYAEEPAPPSDRSRLVGDRIVRVEAIIKQLVSAQQQQTQTQKQTQTPPPHREQPQRRQPQSLSIHSAACSPHPGSPHPSHVRASGAGIPTPASSTTVASLPTMTPRCASVVSDHDDNDMGEDLSESPLLGSPPATTATAATAATAATMTTTTITPMTMTTDHGVDADDTSNERIAAALLAAYPAQEDVDQIVARTQIAYSYYQVIFWSRGTIDLSGGFWRPHELRVRPSPRTHPVVIARQMLVLALVLQISDLRQGRWPQTELSKEPSENCPRNGRCGSDSNGLDRYLSEPSAVIMARLSDTAMALVTINDALLDTGDGLQCIMLEAMYRGNAGNLRRAWLTWRRAFSMAQLMGLSSTSATSTGAGEAQYRGTSRGDVCFRSSTTTVPPPLDPHFLWYRITMAERHMSLLMGLPRVWHGSVTAFDHDTPDALLELRMSEVASQIAERNATWRDDTAAVSRGSSGSGVDDGDDHNDDGNDDDNYATTQEIDRELQEMARSLPGRWWLIPNLRALASVSASTWTDSDDSDGLGGARAESVWDTIRLSHQIIYYHLLHQLHLPYLMAHEGTSTSPMSPRVAARRQYSRQACASSSREILSRYIVFCNVNRIACCYRFLEFYTLMASITLMLLHLDDHATEAAAALSSSLSSSSSFSPLVHQRLSDRAMTEEVLAQMVHMGERTNDALAGDCVHLLQQLLAVEADAATRGATDTLASCAADVRSAGRLCIAVPYVGLVTISRDGTVTKALCNHRETFSMPSAPANAPGARAGGRDDAAVTMDREAQRAECTPDDASPPLPSTTTAPVLGFLPPMPFSCDGPPPPPEPAPARHDVVPPSPPMALRVPLPASQTCGLMAYAPTMVPTTATATSIFPRPISGADQWAFQGVDMTFFDNLIGDAGIGPVSNPMWL